MGTLSWALDAEPIHVHFPPGFSDLYQRFSDTVYRTALRVTGNPADAEDVLQTVFLRFLNIQDRLDPARHPESYFRRAATNAAIDVLRRRSTRAETAIDERRDYPGPENTALLKERLRRAIASLEPRDAEMFCLRYLEGLSNGEIAPLFGVEKTTVAVRLHRIRHMLQEEIEK